MSLELRPCVATLWVSDSALKDRCLTFCCFTMNAEAIFLTSAFAHHRQPPPRQAPALQGGSRPPFLLTALLHHNKFSQ